MSLSELSQWNITLFTLLNAGVNPSGWALALAKFIALYVVYVIPASFILIWLKGHSVQRSALLFNAMATCLALLMSFFIGLAWYYPRPFVAGIGYTYLSHVPDSSFPSDHMAVMWTVGWAFLWQRPLRKLGLLFLVFAISVAWSRIYVGVHYPLDMLGAMVLAILSVSLLKPFHLWIERNLLPWTEKIYRKVFSLPIQTGWVNE